MVDARGLSCPMPVLMVQKEIKKSAPKSLTAVVDDPCAVENISRFAASQGYRVEVREDDGEFTLELRK